MWGMIISFCICGWYSSQHPVSLVLLRHIFECRDYRGNKTALFDGIEEGGIRASHEIDEPNNDSAMEGLQDRVITLKRFFIFMEIEGTVYLKQFTPIVCFLKALVLV
ncbi:hypothetical protein RHGRI_009296 [Rhododendron griersonianum]|uniref:Uncharacterized protein n=1 Tax=Rhododendron griersonianum TaxID=479676 RepID=A0AAV6L3R3_9ERIC|nr:hypothetical protein RHGRI_009296 [Rhododendron griersonianum]